MNAPDKLFGHLTAQSILLLEAPIQDRINAINSEVYVPWDDAEKALDAIRWRLDLPPAPRRPSVMITGDSGMGKTHIFLKLCRDLGVDPAIDATRRDRTLFRCSVSGVTNRREFIERLQNSIAAPHSPMRSPENSLFDLLRVLVESRIRLIVIEEVQDLRAIIGRDFIPVIHAIKLMTNELRVPILMLGSPEAKHIAQDDKHLHTRFTIHELRPWTSPQALQRFIYALVARFPLREPSTIFDELTLKKLIGQTEGNTEKIVLRVRAAARAALKRNSECITRKLLLEEEA